LQGTDESIEVFRISEQHAAAAERQFVQRGADEALTRRGIAIRLVVVQV
jgi:hypothetical protein